MLPETLIKALFAVFSVIIALLDIKKGEVPRAAFVFAFPVFLVLRVMLGRLPLLESAAGMAAGLAVFLLAFAVSSGKLGLADVWYSALIGLVLGLRHWYAAVGLACAGAVAALLVLERRRIPFIPFMAFGSIAMVIFGGWQ